jgi:transcriptional regulator with XRE-family HTH domain
MRSVAGITMEQLAHLIGCNRNSLQQIELGRLKLSEKMAQKIALHTGIDMNWLSRGDYRARPISQHDPNLPYTREIYQRTRADISRPRADPMDGRMLDCFLASAYQQLCAAALEAYERDDLIYFYYQARESLESVTKQSPASNQSAPMDPAQSQQVFRERFEKIRRKKRPSKPMF